MSTRGRELGSWAEHEVCAYLRASGYEILETNFRCREGEIDVVARDGSSLVFVEVKARTGTGYGVPADAVDLKKRQRLARCALRYLIDRKASAQEVRFDVASVLARPGRAPSIRILRGAFDGF